MSPQGFTVFYIELLERATLLILSWAASLTHTIEYIILLLHIYMVTISVLIGVDQLLLMYTSRGVDQLID